MADRAEEMREACAKWLEVTAEAIRADVAKADPADPMNEQGGRDWLLEAANHAEENAERVRRVPLPLREFGGPDDPDTLRKRAERAEGSKIAYAFQIATAISILERLLTANGFAKLEREVRDSFHVRYLKENGFVNLEPELRDSLIVKCAVGTMWKESMVARADIVGADEAYGQIVAAIPLLTPEGVLGVFDALPEVAQPWQQVSGTEDDWFRSTFADATRTGERWEGWTLAPGTPGGVLTYHATAAEARAACDKRLEASGVKLCGGAFCLP